MPKEAVWIQVQRVGRQAKPYAISFALYLIIALLLFLPTIGNVYRSVPGNSADIYQNMWNLWWIKYALSMHMGVYSTTKLLFWPVGYNLVYQTLTPIQGFVSLPFQGISLPFAYNVLFFLGFAVSGIFAFLLIEYITKNRYAAFLGGFFFTFSAFHIAMEFYHSDMFYIGLTPLFTYFLLRSIDGDTRRRYAFAFLAGISFSFIVFADEFEEGIMALLLFFAVMLYYLASKERRGMILRRSFAVSLLLIILGAFATGFWGYLPLLRVLGSGSELNTALHGDTISNNIGWSSNLFSFFVPNYYFYNMGFHAGPLNLFYGADDRTSYIGYTLLLLSAYGAYRYFKRARPWIVLAAVFFLLALGPYVKVGSALTRLPGVYLVYHHIPYLKVIREPARFNIIVTMAMAVLGGLGVKSIIERFRDRKIKVYALSAVLCLLFIAESFGLPVQASNRLTTTPYVPAALKSIVGGAQGNFSFIILPMSPIPNYIYAGLGDYYTTALSKPLVGGYVTRENESEFDTITGLPFITQATYLAVYNNASYYTGHYVSPVNENYTVQSLAMLKAYRTRFILVENKAYGPSGLSLLYEYMDQIFGTPIYNDSNITIFSTGDALRRNLSGYFISYYNQTAWNRVMVYGAYNVLVEGWTPIHGGDMTTYVPDNATSISMSLEAISPEQQRLVVLATPYSENGITNATSNYSIEMARGYGLYRLNLSLTPGPYGNLLHFYDRYSRTGNTSDIALITNITFGYGSG